MACKGPKTPEFPSLRLASGNGTRAGHGEPGTGSEEVPKTPTNKGDSYPSSQRGPGGNPSAQIPQHAYDDDARLQPVRPGLEEEPEAEIQQQPPNCGVADINFGSATLARVNSIPRGHFTTGVYGGDITLSTKQQGGSYSLTKLPFQRLICLSASLAAVPATGAKFSTSNVNVF